jgi:hypothetical protein
MEEYGNEIEDVAPSSEIIDQSVSQAIQDEDRLGAGEDSDNGPETFLDSECGKTGCMLVARGSAILAEIFRLSNHIPDVFLFDKKQSTKGKETFTYISAEGKTLTPEEVRIRYFEHEKYLKVLFSYDYLSNRD